MVMRHAALVGTKITTDTGVTLSIIGHNGASGNGSRHLFHCDECAKDPELFGDGNFWSRIHSITHAGSTPCGCSDAPRWSEWQYYIRCKRAAIASGLRFYGWAEEYRGWKTRLSLYCPFHGGLERATPTSLVVVGRGCRKCYDLRVRDRAISDDEAEERYLGLCGYPEGTRLKRLGKIDSKGVRSYFEVRCPSCASDEYTVAGLCNGVFETDIISLCSGYKACRCGSTKRKPEKIARYQCESLLEDSGIKFIGWKDGYQNARSKIVAKCPEHGLFYPTPQTILNGSRCPACSSGGYSVNKDGFVYLLKSKCGMFLKAGISNNFNNRLYELIRCTPFDFEVLGVKEMQGPAAPVLERSLLEMSDRAGFTGFGGCTEWVEFSQCIIDEFNKH